MLRWLKRETEDPSSLHRGSHYSNPRRRSISLPPVPLNNTQRNHPILPINHRIGPSSYERPGGYGTNRKPFTKRLDAAKEQPQPKHRPNRELRVHLHWYEPTKSSAQQLSLSAGHALRFRPGACADRCACWLWRISNSRALFIRHANLGWQNGSINSYPYNPDKASQLLDSTRLRSIVQRSKNGSVDRSTVAHYVHLQQID